MVQVTADLIDNFEFKVPRYTSYPTAPHFSVEVNHSHYATWLAQQNENTPVSLYFHVPYCDTLCWFCACNTQITKNYRRIESYMEWLKVEAELIYQKLGYKPKVAKIHWGGGSPTLLKQQDWMQMGEILQKYFDVLPDAELSVELDPRDVGREYIQTLADIGINRASIGVQDFDEKVQKAINRIQPFEMTEELILGLREYNIHDINLDIIYGLPYQDMDCTVEMAEKSLKLNPSRVALFGYAHVPWMKPHQKHLPEDDLPGSWERYLQFKKIEEIFEAAGLKSIGLDHFARSSDKLYIAQIEGRLRRNFQGYTDDTAEALIGLGPSSIGSMYQGYVQNQLSISGWKKDLKQGILPIHKGIAIDDDDRLRRRIIEKLMCDFTVDLDEELAAFGEKEFIFDKELKALDFLKDKGLVQLDGHKISVKMEHRLFLRAAAAVFDSYLERKKGKHSKAI